jgi:hypothetical protein
MTKTDIGKKAMISALEKSLGVVATACKIVGMARETHYQWYRKDEDYKKKVDDISELTIDFAESKLHKQIEDGNITAIIFFLKTKAKHRGYIERQEVDNSGTLTIKKIIEGSQDGDNSPE